MALEENTLLQKDTIPEQKSEVELLREQREALKSENDAYEVELLRAERLKAERAVAGKSVITEQPKEETPQEYAKRISSGRV
ncbi:MAG: hypothetical protein HC874_27325 [Richelia sp. SL_2_1]|nr:hypothetical protein [Richelia sp. SL_2_1]